MPESAHDSAGRVGAAVPAGETHENVNDVLTTVLSVMNQTSMEPVDDVNVPGLVVLVKEPRLVADVVEPAYTLAKSKLLSRLKAENESAMLPPVSMIHQQLWQCDVSTGEMVPVF